MELLSCAGRCVDDLWGIAEGHVCSNLLGDPVVRDVVRIRHLVGHVCVLKALVQVFTELPNFREIVGNISQILSDNI